VYELPSTKEVVRFLHAALGNPTQATLLTAAQHGNLVTFPGMTTKNILRHFPESDETQKGHMKQTKQGVRSTKIVDEDAMLGVKHQPGVKHKDLYLNSLRCHQEINVLRSNGEISHHVSSRKQIYHGRC
jgi:hypothetical protein